MYSRGATEASSLEGPKDLAEAEHGSLCPGAGAHLPPTSCCRRDREAALNMWLAEPSSR